MSVEVAVRLVDERNSSRNWSPTPSPVGTRLQSSSTLTGVVSRTTWKTPERPYMGRVLLREVLLAPLIGPAPLVELWGWPTRTLVLPSASDVPLMKASVPSWSQPVKG